jgi:conjugative transfer signal peptidase TraF
MSNAAFSLLGAFSGIVMIAAASPDRPPRLLWNATASLPVGLYAVRSRDAISVDDLVAFALSTEDADWAHARGYLDRSALLLKRVAALPGTEVCRIGDDIRIDGRLVATAQETDSHGRPMPVWAGCKLLGEGQVFLLLAETRDSLDGRYFGPTDAAAIVGLARPIWTRGG